jgi:hypothetical protein
MVRHGCIHLGPRSCSLYVDELLRERNAFALASRDELLAAAGVAA